MFKTPLDEDSQIAILEHHHASPLFHVVQENRETLREWLSFPDKTNEVKDSKAFIAGSLTRLANNNGFWAGIWYRGQLAGAIGYLYVDWKNQKTEIGYWLGSQFEGRGLVTKACQVFIQHAFEKLELNKVEINMAIGNDRSKAVAERLGLKQEGIIRDYEFLNGRFLDRRVYGILRDEWIKSEGTKVDSSI